MHIFLANYIHVSSLNKQAQPDQYPKRSWIPRKQMSKYRVEFITAWFHDRNFRMLIYSFRFNLFTADISRRTVVQERNHLFMQN